LFTHLHVHTEYSLLDGLSGLEKLVARASELGMTSLAITDHGNLHGAIDFYRLCKKAGINPIIGCEIYVAPKSHHDRDQADKKPYHMTLLAKNLEGYRNLVKLVSAAHLEGFYYFPRVDRELLEQHHEGLIVLSGCPSGEVPKLIASGQLDEARATAEWYRDTFGDYYLELMEHGGVPEFQAINEGLVQLNADTGIPMVATNDSHYVRQEDAYLQDILVCIHTNTNVNDEKRMRMTEDSYYLKSYEEMAALHPDNPEAIANTMKIAEMCDLELDFSKLYLPTYPCPDGLTSEQYLAKLCEEGLQRRVGQPDDQHQQRLAYELDVIRQTRYDDYFLVVWDIARFVRENDISFAVRGSAAGSLVLYSLGITDVNPLIYDIVFERFLNVERKEMPDIDMDFQDDRRVEVLNYVVSKYGRDHVAQIITFGTLGAKASIRDVGRALAMPYDQVDRIARLVPTRLNIKLKEAIDETPELQELSDSDEGVRKLLEIAQGLEGTTRHSSIHAAGVVISAEPLENLVPLQRPPKGDEQSVSTTQYAMEPVAALGLLKMDFLGLSNLTILARAKNLIAENRGINIDLKSLPLDDQPTLQMLSDGHTVGVFQLEGGGMTDHIKNLKPRSMVDVASMIALYRPGPMEQIGTFIEARHGRAEAIYPHPSLISILAQTYGIIVYQDQVLLIAQAFAGYSLGEADVLRKAMGKKVQAIMDQEKEKFIKGAIAQGHPLDLAESVFMLIEPFAGYGFPKAHAVSYGLISYWTGYLKANYPEEYMSCLLNAYAGNTDKTATAVAECKRIGFAVLPPDIQRSQSQFALEKQHDGRTAIRFGLSNVKNVGAGSVVPFIESRAEVDGPVTTIEELCRATDMSGVTRKTLESLVKAGAFDRFGDRGGIISSIDRIHSLAQSEATLRNSDQTSMFDMFGESVPSPLASIEFPEGTTSDSEKKGWELELLGVAFSGTKRLDIAAAGGKANGVMSRGQITATMSGSKVTLTGQIASTTKRSTKTGKPYLIATLALLDGEIDVFVWDNVMTETPGLWEAGSTVVITGTVKARDDRVSISCLTATPYRVPREEPTTPVTTPQAPAPFATNGAPNGSSTNGGVATTNSNGNRSHRRLKLKIRETENSMDDRRLLEDISRLLLDHQGDDEVSLEIASNGQVFTMDWTVVRVRITPELESMLGDTLRGEAHFVVEDGA